MQLTEEIKKQFSTRLREAMVYNGYRSSSSTGVSLTALARAASCSKTVASRYLHAKAIPNLEKTLKIAQWLNIDPGFLCFGDLSLGPQASNTIKMKRDLLTYFLKKFVPITKKATNDAELIDFFVSILLDLSALQTNAEELKNIFDIAFKLPLIKEKVHGESNDFSSKIA